ncbi:Spo0E family sporulation regulatory protein-aspartic acid phosphatase (plasmid) [Bacillus wiedmannii bv. thuringiensis]|nr:Spo0E family sporulation regulatory protein-aspartic acid phosphatase [Bacillus wiedmannii bv. thuringiensis]
MFKLISFFAPEPKKVIDFSQKLDLLIYEAMGKYRLDQQMRIKKESLIQ